MLFRPSGYRAVNISCRGFAHHVRKDFSRQCKSLSIESLFCCWSKVACSRKPYDFPFFSSLPEIKRFWASNLNACGVRESLMFARAAGRTDGSLTLKHALCSDFLRVRGTCRNWMKELLLATWTTQCFYCKAFGYCVSEFSLSHFHHDSQP